MAQQPQKHLRILILAPQPFYQDRGTPIAVRLLATELARLGHQVDLLVFHEGEDVSIPGVTIFRTRSSPYLKNIPPGFSLKKIICDLRMYAVADTLLQAHSYDLVHAVEESVFIAMRLSKKHGIPYIYDMDSSLPIQLMDKAPFLRILGSPLQWFEKRAAQNSSGIVAVCQELVDLAVSYSPQTPTVCLEDIDLQEFREGGEDLRSKYNLASPLLLYVGNLESYQGIDLLLESFSVIKEEQEPPQLVIIGGSEKHISHYRGIAKEAGLEPFIFFCGPRDFSLLGYYLAQADILVSPRTKGNNTPMKIYSYLGSGKAILATRLPTHTQVLDDTVACLREPTPESFADGIVTLINNKDVSEKLGENGKNLARERYSIESYRRKLADFYQDICD
jgi:glycosyltransferase involved in cell wall biosynthesis